MDAIAEISRPIVEPGRRDAFEEPKERALRFRRQFMADNLDFLPVIDKDAAQEEIVFLRSSVKNGGEMKKADELEVMVMDGNPIQTAIAINLVREELKRIAGGSTQIEPPQNASHPRSKLVNNLVDIARSHNSPRSLVTRLATVVMKP